jgi:NAD(P)-dependent dehydrogenase (short-subunit alcohol dehydrogenase family)
MSPLLEPFGSLGGETAVITGGGGGIGRAIAAALLRAGANVVLNDRRADSLLDAASTLVSEVGGLVTVPADVSTRDGARTVIDAAVRSFGSLSILVNVAGGMRGDPNVPFLELDDGQWDFAITINLRTTFECMQAALAVMVPQRRGRIVNIASTAWAGGPERSDYSAAKAAVVALTRSVATQVAPHGVTVNAVAPGLTSTEAVPEDFQGTSSDIPLGRWNEPQDVASAVQFLCSNAARNVSGHLLTVAGGLNPSL